MAFSVFGDKESPPNDGSLSDHLKDSMRSWQKLNAEIGKACPDVEGMWKFPTKAAGWTWTERSGKRNILYRQPCEGYFRVTIVLGEPAAEKALSGTLPDAVKSAIREARPYMEGRSIPIDVRGDGDVAAVIELLRIKLSN